MDLWQDNNYWPIDLEVLDMPNLESTLKVNVIHWYSKYHGDVVCAKNSTDSKFEPFIRASFCLSRRWKQHHAP